jgi:hypothetical protein
MSKIALEVAFNLNTSLSQQTNISSYLHRTLSISSEIFQFVPTEMKLCGIFTTLVAFTCEVASAFSPQAQRLTITNPSALSVSGNVINSYKSDQQRRSSALKATPDLAVVSLVAGQENYGLAIVALGEAVWSFVEAPSLSHAKVLVPAAIAAVILCAVSGPMITNAADAESVQLGLEIATGVSMGLGASYVARLLSPYSPSAKEIAFGGLLIAIAGFFSFSQNLIVDGFINLPSIPLPKFPNVFDGVPLDAEMFQQESL